MKLDRIILILLISLLSACSSTNQVNVNVSEETPKKTKKKVPIISALTAFQFVFSNM